MSAPIIRSASRVIYPVSPRLTRYPLPPLTHKPTAESSRPSPWEIDMNKGHYNIYKIEYVSSRAVYFGRADWRIGGCRWPANRRLTTSHRLIIYNTPLNFISWRMRLLFFPTSDSGEYQGSVFSTSGSEEYRGFSSQILENIGFVLPNFRS